MPTIKVFDDLVNTVFDIIDAADTKGRTHFVAPARFMPKDVKPWTQAGLHALLERALRPHGLFFSSSKAWPKAIQAEQAELENGDFLVGFNAAKFFMLPGLKPRKELAELRELFEEMKAFFLAHADAPRPPQLRMMNERDRHGRVYGTCTAILEDGKTSDIESRLHARFEASPALQHFQRQYALALGKIGRYSWFNLTEENFFPMTERPWENAFRKRHEETQKRAGASPGPAAC